MHEVKLTANLHNGTFIEGTDTIQAVGKNAWARLLLLLENLSASLKQLAALLYSV
ncbi:hypothetical protein HY622_03665 [Candidatus Uhrbacteria bacterium]|nr:hypothetical protein [Candidatus Uhrbacteria bacterium]